MYSSRIFSPVFIPGKHSRLIFLRVWSVDSLCNIPGKYWDVARLPSPCQRCKQWDPDICATNFKLELSVWVKRCESVSVFLRLKSVDDVLEEQGSLHNVTKPDSQSSHMCICLHFSSSHHLPHAVPNHYDILFSVKNLRVFVVHTMNGHQGLSRLKKHHKNIITRVHVRQYIRRFPIHFRSDVFL